MLPDVALRMICLSGIRQKIVPLIDNGMPVLRMAQTRLYTLNPMRIPLFRGPVSHRLSDLSLHIDTCSKDAVDRPCQYFEKSINIVETGEIIHLS
jgi:hypothetical protein